MPNDRRLSLLVFLVLLLFAPLNATASPAAQTEGSPRSEPLQGTETTGSPLFVENVGQFDEEARFQMWGGPGTMWLAEDGLWISVIESEEEAADPALDRGDKELAFAEKETPREAVHLRLHFEGASPHPRLEPFDRQETAVSYFTGGDADAWRTEVPVWGGVRYVDLYPGLDLEIGGENGRWTWRMVGEEGVTDALSQVRLRIEGAADLELPQGDEGSALQVETDLGSLSLPLLQAVTTAGRPLEAPAPTLKAHEAEIVSPFGDSGSTPASRTSSLQDQPDDLLYGTFLGGGDTDYGAGIAVDGARCAYVTGWTRSIDFPTGPGYDTEHDGYSDAFVIKLNAGGTDLEYATFLGGEDSDEGKGIAVDEAGNAYVVGHTYSPASSGFPVTIGPDLSHNGGSVDAFVAKVKTDGSGLDYCGYIGGSSGDRAYGVSVDETGNAYVVGSTSSSQADNFPLIAGPSLDYSGGSDAFVAKVQADGNGLDYCGYIGGARNEGPRDIAVDTVGRAYIIGGTKSASLPVAIGPDLTYNGEHDAFVARVKADGTGLEYCGYIGGVEVDYGYGISVDETGSAYVVGYTLSSEASFPSVVGPDLTYNDTFEKDAFVAKVASDGSNLDYCGYIGGSREDIGEGIAVDGTGNAYVVGKAVSTEEDGFPAVVGPNLGYSSGGFVAKVRGDGTGLTYCGYLGSALPSDVAVDRAGNTYISGSTEATGTNFPAGPGYDTSYNGQKDAFVVKLAMGEKLEVHYYSQNDPEWEGEDLGESTRYTIGSDGCALTSMAMVVEYYSDAPEGEWDPGELNAGLRDADGFDRALLIWRSIVPFSDQIIKDVSDHSYGRVYAENPYNPEWNYESIIHNALDDKKPVIVQTQPRPREEGPSHFVTVIGGQGPHYIVHDPEGPPDREGEAISYSETLFNPPIDDMSRVIVLEPDEDRIPTPPPNPDPELDVQTAMAVEDSDLKELTWHSIDPLEETGLFSFVKDIVSRLVMVFSWGGSRLQVTVYRPDGSVYDVVESQYPPIVISIPEAQAGTWEYKVTGTDIPEENYPYVVGIGEGPVEHIPRQLFLPVVRNE